MKKPLLVTHLVFAGLMSVGLTNDTASHNYLSTNADPTVRTISHSQTEQNDLLTESRPGATSSSATLLPNALSTTADTSVWGGGSCSPVPVEVKPCQ